MKKMNQTLEQILTVEAAAGAFGQADAVLEQTLRDFIELQSTTIAVGTNVVGVRSVPYLEFTWYTGAEGTFTYPLADNAVADPTKIGTANYSVHLKKGQGRCIFLDSTLLRGETFENMDRQQMAIVRNRASVIDNLIIDALIDGAGQSLAVAGGSECDTSSADAEANILGTPLSQLKFGVKNHGRYRQACRRTEQTDRHGSRRACQGAGRRVGR